MVNLGIIFVLKFDKENKIYWLDQALNHKDALSDKGKCIVDLLEALDKIDFSYFK
jgi:hypothetical protein